MNEEKLKFVERLKEVVNLLGYKEHGRQTQLAKYYNLKQPTINSWFSGNTMPSYAICVDLCKRAGVNFYWFMTGRGKRDYIDGVSLDQKKRALFLLIDSMSEADQETAFKIFNAFTKSSDRKAS